jgi:intracellular septation protein A
MSSVSQTPRRSEAPVLLRAARPVLEDLGRTLAFYLVYLLTGSPRVGAGIGLAVGLAQLAGFRMRRETPPALLLTGLALTVVLGGLTYVTRDARFLLVKPSIIYACVGAAMLPKGWLARYLPAVVRELAPAVAIDRAGRAWAGLMFGTALLNLALVAVLPPRSAAGVLAIWAGGSKLVLFAAQYAGLRRQVRRALGDGREAKRHEVA